MNGKLAAEIGLPVANVAGIGSERVEPCASTSALPRAEMAVEQVAELVSRRWGAVLAIWLCGTAAAFAGMSSQKLMWNDELICRWIAMLPSLRDVWSALTAAIGLDPPLWHIVNHMLIEEFGASSLVMRLPSIIGFCLMLSFLFLLLKRHVGPLYALLALVLPFYKPFREYGFEARSYAFMYGFIAVAIYCWTRAGGRDSGRWSVGFGLALTAVLGCHFYAVFVLPAFVLGETVRSMRRRRIDWSAAGAIFAACATLLLYRPIIVSAHRYSENYFGKPELLSAPSMLIDTLKALIIPLFLFFLLVSLCGAMGFRLRPDPDARDDTRFAEMAALSFGFLLIPLFGWIAGVIYLKTFVTRYVLHGLFGVFLIVPLFAARAFGSNRALGLVLLFACGLAPVLYMVRGTAYNFKAPVRFEDATLLKRAITGIDGDVVVSDPGEFMQLVQYEPSLKSRCIHLTDRQKEVRYTGQDGVSRGYPEMARLGAFRTQSWQSYSSRHDRFILLSAPDSQSDGMGWLRAYLRDTGHYGPKLSTVGRLVLVEAQPGRE